MSEKHRNLPLWMVKSDHQRSKGTSVVRKETKGTQNHPRSVEYWMNERELVETALCVLKESKECDGAEEDTGDAEMVIPETSDSEVSDVDCAMTSQRGEPSQTHDADGGDAGGDAAGDDDAAGDADADALDLVRQIFFT